MSTSRRTNAKLLKRIIEQRGELAFEKFAVEAAVSFPTLRLYTSKKSRYLAPKHDTRKRICEATGQDEDVLFPVKKVRSKVG